VPLTYLLLWYNTNLLLAQVRFEEIQAAQHLNSTCDEEGAPACKQVVVLVQPIDRATGELPARTSALDPATAAPASAAAAAGEENTATGSAGEETSTWYVVPGGGAPVYGLAAPSGQERDAWSTDPADEVAAATDAWYSCRERAAAAAKELATGNGGKVDEIQVVPVAVAGAAVRLPAFNAGCALLNGVSVRHLHCMVCLGARTRQQSHI
jgi:hypothetical protein